MADKTPPDNNVVFLAYRNPELVPDIVEHMSCKNCKNKTFTMTHINNALFPTVKCACCSNEIGVMGWIPEDQHQ
jgi:hypothetical protein